MNAETHYLAVLREELGRRVEKNPRYSMRAFSKSLNIAASALSEIMNGRRTPSFKMASKITQSLGLAPDEHETFMESIADEFKSKGLNKVLPAKDKDSQEKSLSLETFKVMADWYHCAILELTFVKGFQSNPNWVASQLGIAPAQAKVAIERLKALELLSDESGCLRKTDAHVSTADKTLSSAAHKRHQEQCLEMALNSLENDPIELRSMTTYTMAIDTKKMAQAKKLISKFNKDMGALMETGTREQVYNLSVALYPITKTKGN